MYFGVAASWRTAPSRSIYIEAVPARHFHRQRMEAAILLQRLRREAQNIDVLWRSGELAHRSIQVVRVPNVAAAGAICELRLKNLKIPSPRNRQAARIQEIGRASC